MADNSTKLSFSERMCAFRKNFDGKMAPIEARLDSKTSQFNKFFYSNWYLLLLLIVSFVCWYLDKTIIGMMLLAVIALVELILNKDITPMLPIMPLMLMVVSKDTFLETPSNVTAIAIAGTIFAVGVLFNIIFYRQRLRAGRLTIPFIMVCIVLFLGGIGSPYIKDYADGMVFMISLGPLMLGVYTYIMSCARVPKKVDTRLYFARLIALITCLCALQVLCAHIKWHMAHPESEFIEHFRLVLSVGWSNRAGMVIMLTLGLSSVFYYADNAKRFNFALYNFACSMYLALMFTCGRGGMIFGTLEMIVITIYLLAKGKHRGQFAATLGLWLVCVIVVIGVGYDVVVDIMEKFKDLGLDSSGRTDLYAEGWELFKKYPIFGVGFGYRGFMSFNEVCIYWFHSTLIQVLASMGIVGLIAYVTYYWGRLRILFEKRNPYNLMMIFALFAFEAHSLIDAGTFEPLPFLFTAVLINTFVEYVNREEYDEELEAYLENIQGNVRLSNARRAALLAKQNNG